MEVKMKIYDVVNDYQAGKLVIAEVEVDEKPKTFIVKSSTYSHAYDYGTRICKVKAMLTPRAAVNKKLEQSRESVKNLKLRLAAAEKDVEDCINLI
jgi:hypothetical protein